MEIPALMNWHRRRAVTAALPLGTYSGKPAKWYGLCQFLLPSAVLRQEEDLGSGWADRDDVCLDFPRERGSPVQFLLPSRRHCVCGGGEGGLTISGLPGIASGAFEFAAWH